MLNSLISGCLNLYISLIDVDIDVAADCSGRMLSVSIVAKLRAGYGCARDINYALAAQPAAVSARQHVKPMKERNI